MGTRRRGKKQKDVLRRLLLIRHYKLLRPFWQAIRWAVTAKEITNLTYDLTPLNKSYLTAFVAAVTSKPFDEIHRYLTEIENDDSLVRHITNQIQASPFRDVTEREVFYGRRLGWYCIARAIKPKVIVETGVEKGLGSCVLTSALLRNVEEGFPGHYFGTDIVPDAGYLLAGQYAEIGTILHGDSIESLKQFDQSIDFFINDSDHSAEYEAREYEAVETKLSDNAIILGDNSHGNTNLLEFAQATGRQFLFFREDPADHWYPGAGIGVAFR